LILTDREIQISLERKLIFIEPLPSEEAFSSTSVDLTLDAEITRFNANPQFMRQAIDVTHQDYDYELALAQLSTNSQITATGFELPRNELILGWTAEYINIPRCAIGGARRGKEFTRPLRNCRSSYSPNYSCRLQGQSSVRDSQSWPSSYSPQVRHENLSAYI
jgi:hypothetical protein